MYSWPGDAYPYQPEIAAKLLTLPGAMVWADVGAGKTAPIMKAACDLLDAGEIRRWLVVAPKHVAAETWPKEMTDWDFPAGRPWTSLVGVPARKFGQAVLYPERTQFVFLHYEMMTKYLNAVPPALWPNGVIYDELHSLKGSPAKVSRVKTAHEYRTAFKRRWGLTATPTAQGMEGLWSQAHAISLDHTLGKNITSYRQTFFLEQVLGRRRSYDLKPGARDEILKRVAPFTIRIDLRDYKAVKDLAYHDTVVQLPAKARGHYEEMRRNLVTYIREAEAEGVSREIIAVGAGAKLSKMRQICAGALYPGDNEAAVPMHGMKEAAVKALFDSLDGDQLIVVCQFKFEYDVYKRALPGSKLIKEPGAIKDFQAGKIPALIMHPKSGGPGLNLHYHCRHLAWASLPHGSLGDYIQANGRLRQNVVDHQCNIYHVLAQDTLDTQLVLPQLRARDNEQLDTLDAIKEWLQL